MRYRKLGYVALNVTDLERSTAFYRDLLGLQESGRIGRDAAALRCSSNHHDVILCRGAVPGLKRIGWEMESEDELEAARRRLETAGLVTTPVPAAECEDLRQGPSFRVREPATGAAFEFYATQAKLAAYEVTVAKIQRLGHVVFNVERFDQAMASLTGDFGFRVSDMIDDAVAFMRCFPNPYHHSLAVARSDETRLNHVNFMVSDIDDIGRAIYRMKRADVPVVFGPGRHVPSESIFLYFLDPDGITIEYSFGMEEFPEDGARPPRRLQPTLEVLDSWGGAPSPEMGKVGAIETAS